MGRSWLGESGLEQVYRGNAERSPEPRQRRNGRVVGAPLFKFPNMRFGEPCGGRYLLKR